VLPHHFKVKDNNIKDPISTSPRGKMECWKHHEKIEKPRTPTALKEEVTKKILSLCS
jgi:hypothetical protein